MVGFLKKGIINLKPQGVEKVKIYGKNSGDDFPEWSSEFELVSESNRLSIDIDKIDSENVVLTNSKNLQKSSETVQGFEAHGKNGIIRLTKNRVIISREGYWGFISQGESGSKEIPIKNITAVQFKSCSATTGYYFDKLRTNKYFVGICAIFLGELGVHKFLLGYHISGFILLGVTIFISHSIDSIIFLIFLIKAIVIIEGIIYMSIPSKVFQTRYIHNRKVWF